MPMKAETLAAARLGECQPLLDPRFDLVGRKVLRRDRASSVPIAAEGISEGEILANARIGARRARTAFEQLDRGIAVAGERKRQADIRRIEISLRVLEQRQRVGRAAGGDAGQGELEDDLRL